LAGLEEMVQKEKAEKAEARERTSRRLPN